jgi:hypothetical protein
MLPGSLPPSLSHLESARSRWSGSSGALVSDTWQFLCGKFYGRPYPDLMIAGMIAMRRQRIDRRKVPA